MEVPLPSWRKIRLKGLYLSVGLRPWHVLYTQPSPQIDAKYQHGGHAALVQKSFKEVLPQVRLNWILLLPPLFWPRPRTKKEVTFCWLKGQAQENQGNQVS